MSKIAGRHRDGDPDGRVGCVGRLIYAPRRETEIEVRPCALRFACSCAWDSDLRGACMHEPPPPPSGTPGDVDLETSALFVRCGCFGNWAKMGRRMVAK